MPDASGRFRGIAVPADAWERVFGKPEPKPSALRHPGAAEGRRMKVLVTGSRDWTDREAIRSRLALIPFLFSDPPTVIHGDARGADRLAADVAKRLGADVEPFPADWQTHGRRAGYLRNLLMLDQAPDLVLAFQRNGSRGTQHTIDEARKRGIPVEVYTA